jgi:predicted dehydrogenase
MKTAKNKELKIAVVGLGKMGLLHSSILNVSPNIQLAAFCDKSWLMRKIAKGVLKVPLVTENLDQLSDLDLDAIYVTTPIPSHYNVIKEVYAKNIACNLFVEKTLSSTYATSKELFNLSQTCNGIAMVGYMKRFSVTFKKARELISQEILGQLLSFDAYAYSSDFVDVKEGSSISGARGGALEDLGSHVVDLALWFFGDLNVGSARIESRISIGSVDSVNFRVSGSNGLEGKFDVSWCKRGYRMPEFGLTIKGTNGVLMVNDSVLKLELNHVKPREWYRQDLDDNVCFLLGDSEYFREDETFVKSIAYGGSPEPNFQTAMKVDSLLEEVRCKAHE